jgi:16S rRNA G966 N2-methylase RsmD
MRSRSPYFSAAALLLGLGSGIFEIDLIRLSKIIFRFDTAFIWFAAAVFFIICGHAWSIIRRPGPHVLLQAALCIGASALFCHISPWPWYFLLPLFPFFLIGQAHVILYSSPEINRLIYIFEVLGFALGMSIAGPWLTSLPLVAVPGSMTAAGLLLLAAYYLVKSNSSPLADSTIDDTPNPDSSANANHSAPCSSFRKLLFFLIISLPMILNICSDDWLSRRAGVMDGPVSTHLREEIQVKGLKRHVCHESLSARTDEIVNNLDQTLFYTDAMFCAKAVRIKDSGKGGYDLVNPETVKMAFLKRLPFLLASKVTAEVPEPGLIGRNKASNRPLKVLNLGAGAGFDTVIALQEGAANITAVEINSTITSQAMKLKNTSGRCYLDKRVTLVNAEARSWLTQNKETFDLITLALMECSDSAGPSSMFIHAPLFTVQAFELYWDHLSDEGMTAVIHNQKAPVESNLSALLKMFERRKIKNPASHFIVIFPDKPFINSFDHLLLISKKPFTQEKIKRINYLLKDSTYPRDVFHIENSSRLITTGISRQEKAPEDNRPFLFSRIYGFQNMFGLFIVLFIMLFTFFLICLKKTCSPRIFKTGLILFTASSGIIMIQTALLYLAQSLLGYPSTAASVVGGAAVLGSVTGAFLCRKRVGLFIFTVPLIWTGLYFLYRPFDFTFYSRLISGIIPGSAAGKVLLASDNSLFFHTMVIAVITFISFLFTGLLFVKAMTSEDLKQAADEEINRTTAVFLLSDGLGYITGATGALLLSYVLGYSNLVIAGIVLFCAAVLIYFTGRQ